MRAIHVCPGKSDKTHHLSTILHLCMKHYAKQQLGYAKFVNQWNELQIFDNFPQIQRELLTASLATCVTTHKTLKKARLSLVCVTDPILQF